MPSTSTLGPAQEFTGFQLGISDGASPPNWNTICNISSFAIPTISEKVDVTNAGDTYRRRIPVLLDMGDVTFNIFWVPKEDTHKNVAIGLRYLQQNKTLKTYRALYPDNSYDIFPAYVTGFQIQGAVGGVFTGSITLNNSGAPTAIA